MGSGGNLITRRRVVVAAVSMTVTLATGADAGAARVASAPPSTEPVLDLDAAAAAFVGDHPGGVAVLVVEDGTTTAVAAGVANAAGEPMTTDAVFRIGSLTKPFVGTIVMQLVDDGLVDLDEPLSTYLPDTPVGGDVRVRDLLRHRSGLPNYTDADDFLAEVLADRDRHFTPDEVLGLIAEIPPGEPDREFAYSNTNYILLGQLIEHVEGSDLDTVLRDRIAGPLGLEATQLAIAGSAAIDGLAGAWSPDVPLDGDPAASYDSIASLAWSAGGIVSTVSDLRAFLDGLFGGELMSEAAFAEMTTTEPDEYGLGIGLLVLPTGTRLFGHEGGIPGYLSLMAIEPVSGDILVVLTNSDDLQPVELAEQILADW